MSVISSNTENTEKFNHKEQLRIQSNIGNKHIQTIRQFGEGGTSNEATLKRSQLKSFKKQQKCDGSIHKDASITEWFRLHYLSDIPLYLTMDDLNLDFDRLASDYMPYGLKGLARE
ncbi:uncharacterized protein LOC144352625, partial [Saccoglossus kowalevskii]